MLLPLLSHFWLFRSAFFSLFPFFFFLALFSQKNTHISSPHIQSIPHTKKKSIFSFQLFLLRVKKNTTDTCKQLLCAKSFRGACAYYKFPGRSDAAMCGGLEIGESLLGHFLCESKGAFFSVLQFLFFFGGVVSGIFRLKKRFLFYKNSLSSHSLTGLFFARGIAG